MNSSTMGLVDQLAEIVGVDAVKTDSVDLNHFGKIGLKSACLTQLL